MVRVIAGTFQRIRRQEIQLAQLPRIFQDLLAISSDNAQRLAKSQLEASIAARQQKGAISLLKESEFDLTDDNIIQSSHVDAISKLSKFKTQIDKALPKTQKPKRSDGFRRQPQNPRNGGGGRGGRGRGGGGRGRGRSRNQGSDRNNAANNQENE